MEITLFTPHQGQKTVINGFSSSDHKFGTVVTSRQWGKSLLGQNLLLYWLLSNPKQKGAWISPIYNQGKKVFQELSNASHKVINKSNKADLTIEFLNGSTLQFLSAERADSESAIIVILSAPNSVAKFLRQSNLSNPLIRCFLPPALAFWLLNRK